jgi:hypothetical protein
MGVSSRFDIPDSSCVNNEIDCFNNKLVKIVKPFKFSSLLRIEQRRENFITHGAHLNATGKVLVTKQIVSYVNSIFNQKEETPICMGWKAESDVCTFHMNKLKQGYSSLVTSTSNLENNNNSVNDLNSRKVIDNQVLNSMQERMSDQVTADLVCLEKQLTPKSLVTKPDVNRTSSRIRKAPVTKNDNFLW